MGHVVQVGAGSGGIAVLDLICRESSVTQVTLIEPDVYKPHNVTRHLFSSAGVGELKADLTEVWLKDRRPDLEVRLIPANLLDPQQAQAIEEQIKKSSVGVCAADNEEAKYHFDALMRKHRKPWTLGEVLSGGVGGFVHWFRPDGACYGCVASHLQRSVVVDKPKTPDYSEPQAAHEEMSIPASRASISAVASLHALITLELLADPDGYQPGFTSLLWTLQRVPDVFEEAFRPYRFRIPRSAECLICRNDSKSEASTPEDLDAALDQALARLDDA